MKALLIFAGKSTRFWPLKEKSFTVIAGKTLLEHQVERLRAAGIRDIVFVAGDHNIEEAKALFPGIQVIRQSDPSLGMRGALLSALPKIGDVPLLLVSANDVLEPGAYRSLVSALRTPKLDGLILAKKVATYFPGGYVTRRGKRMTGIVEKPGAGNEPGDLVNIVAHVHRSPKTLLRALQSVRGKNDDGYERAITTLCKTHEYEVVPYTGLWQAVKYPWHLLELLPVLLGELKKASRASTARVHRSAVIEGPVTLGKNVRVLPHATIIGPATIGDDSIIGNNVLVRQSSVGGRCIVGYNTEVVRSIVADDVWTHSSYIGDSVIGRNVSLGGCTTIGNLRLDEGEIHSAIGGEQLPTGLRKFGTIIGSGCRTGIHTCVSPGVKIGEDCFIAGNTLITADIPDRSYVKPEHSKLLVRPNRQVAPRLEQRSEFRRKL